LPDLFRDIYRARNVPYVATLAYRCVILVDTLYSKPQSDDFFDLDEVFAEYFMSEPDELVAYTSSMINCGGTSNVTDMDMSMSMDMVGSMALDQRKPIPGPGNHLFLAMGGNKAVFPQPEDGAEEDGASQPPTKKVKQEGTDSCLAAVAPYSFEHPDWHAMMSQYQQMLNQDQQPLENQEHTQQLQQHHAQQLQQIIELQAQADSCVSVPVGVSRHSGDVGDVAPATIQSTPCDPMEHDQCTMEGYGSWAVPDHESADRRQKEKNRKYAKQFRVRTKSMFESLREELESLKKQNTDLRTIVHENIPDHAMQIIAECSGATNPLLAEADKTEPAATGGEQQDPAESDLLWIKSAPNPLRALMDHTY
jgi:hypothetical protein